MRRSRTIHLLPLLALCFPAAAIGQADTTRVEKPCGMGPFRFMAPDSLRAAEVTGVPNARIHFLNDDYHDDAVCPNAGEARCAERSYVVPGNRVLVAGRHLDWLCSWHQPPGPAQAEFVGWLPVAGLNVSATHTDRAADAWVGTWWYYDNSLEIAREAESGALGVKGRGMWHDWANGRERVRYRTVNAKLSPRGNELALQDGRCRVTLKLVGDFLIARDNLECGRPTASDDDPEIFNGVFHGVYQRDPPLRPQAPPTR